MQTDLWSKLLWNYYLPQVANGGPFYLAADEDLIACLRSDFDSSMVLNEFHKASNELLERGFRLARVKRIAFERIPGECYSRAICLAVQQVLAVEMMLNNEEQGYTEQSYFPRYRECLGIAGDEHTNPFESGSFERIWDTLAKELVEVEGADDSTVTFRMGQGRDLNRNLPFSQALFTTHDLTVIKSKASHLNKESSEISIQQAIWQVRSSLGRRAQKLLTRDNETILKLCKQVQAFLSSERFLSSLERKKMRTADSRTAVAFLSEDWFDDAFCFYLKSESEQFEGPVVGEVLKQRAIAYGAILLSAYEGCFSEVQTPDEMAEGEAILIVVANSEEARFCKKFDDIYVGSCILEPCESNLSNWFSVLHCRSVPDRRLCNVLGIGLGLAKANKIELEGGLMADGRSRVFLAGYGPTSLRYKGAMVAPETFIIVNGVRIQLSNFLQKVSLVQEFKSYLIEIDESELEFKISPKRLQIGEADSVVVGYRLESVELGASCALLARGEPGLRGTVLTEPIIETTTALEAGPDRLNRRDIVLLANKGKRIKLSDKRMKEIMELLESTENFDALGKLVRRQIALTNSIPLKFLKTGGFNRAK